MVLRLTIKKKWFDLISSGIKKEEYREVKPYWISRLMLTDGTFKKFDKIEFINGYKKDSPRITTECNGIIKGFGNPDLGAFKDKEVFIIKLGNVLEP